METSKPVVSQEQEETEAGRLSPETIARELKKVSTQLQTYSSDEPVPEPEAQEASGDDRTDDTTAATEQSAVVEPTAPSSTPAPEPAEATTEEIHHEPPPAEDDEPAVKAQPEQEKPSGPKTYGRSKARRGPAPRTGSDSTTDPSAAEPEKESAAEPVAEPAEEPSPPSDSSSTQTVASFGRSKRKKPRA